MREFDDSTPVDSIPDGLPEGERLVWQGHPDFRTFAIRALHVRKIAIYFAILMAWRFGEDVAAGFAVTDGLISALWILPLAVISLAFLIGFAWMVRKTTVYTVTTRRLILRHGVALPKTVTIPFELIESVDVKAHPDGSGDIAAAVSSDHRISLVMLWPHARPWHLGRPQAALRAVPDAAAVAEKLAEALAGATTRQSTARQARPSDTAVGERPGSLAPAAG